MQITSPKNTIAAVAVAAAVLAPATAQARGEHGHGAGEGQRGADAQQAPVRAHGRRWRTVVVTGTVVSVDGDVVTVQVRGANHHGAALRNQQVQLDVSSARVRVKDVNSDGTRDAADVATGDRVVAQLRVPRGTSVDLTQALPARSLVDVGPAPSQSSDSTDSTNDG